MPVRGFTIAARLRSVRFACRGVVTMLGSQHNAWLHAACTITVCVAATLCRVDRFEWGLIILAVIAVWTAEALNTALEFLCDVASPEFHPLIERAKDVAAGGVLLSAAGSVVIGLLVFVPPLARALSTASISG